MRKAPELQKPVRAGALRKDEGTKVAPHPVVEATCASCGSTDKATVDGTTVLYHKPNCKLYARKP